jgi:ribonuclease BN (tRNA processing enzyme)
MQKLKIHFIGTVSGKVSLKRFHTNFILSFDKQNLLIDAGDGVTKAMLGQDIDFDSIDTILFSHFHPDHYCGFPMLINQMKMNNRTKPLSVFVHSTLASVLKNFLLQTYMLPERMSFKINFIEYEFGNPFKIFNNIIANSKLNSHLEKLRGYNSAKNLSFASSSFLFNFDGEKLFYSGDIGKKEDIFLFSDENPGYFILNTTHLEIDKLFKVLDKLNAKKIILTHISDEDEELINKKYNLLLPVMKDKVLIPDDNDTIILN